MASVLVPSGHETSVKENRCFFGGALSYNQSMTLLYIIVSEKTSDINFEAQDLKTSVRQS